MKFPWSFFWSIFTIGICVPIIFGASLHMIKGEDFSIILTLADCWHNTLFALASSLFIMILEFLENHIVSYNGLIKNHNELCDEMNEFTDHHNALIKDHNLLEERLNKLIAENDLKTEEDYVEILYKGKPVTLTYKTE